MKPLIEETEFGSITVGGSTYPHDIYVFTDGRISKRKKKLSKAVYGTSHIISKDEVEYLFETGLDGLLIGTGQYDRVELSAEAEEFLKKRKCKFSLYSTPEAIKKWNDLQGAYSGLFHVTC